MEDVCSAHGFGEAVAWDPEDEAELGWFLANGPLDDFRFVGGEGDLAIVGGGAGLDEGLVEVLELDVFVPDVLDEFG
jgi:hypothetical protein